MRSLTKRNLVMKRLCSCKNCEKEAMRVGVRKVGKKHVVDIISCHHCGWITEGNLRRVPNGME